MNIIYLLLIHDSPYGWTADRSWAERWAQSHQDRGWSALTHYPSPEENAEPLLDQIHPLGKPVRH